MISISRPSSGRGMAPARTAARKLPLLLAVLWLALLPVFVPGTAAAQSAAQSAAPAVNLQIRGLPSRLEQGAVRALEHRGDALVLWVDVAARQHRVEIRPWPADIVLRACAGCLLRADTRGSVSGVSRRLELWEGETLRLVVGIDTDRRTVVLPGVRLGDGLPLQATAPAGRQRAAVGLSDAAGAFSAQPGGDTRLTSGGREWVFRLVGATMKRPPVAPPAPTAQTANAGRSASGEPGDPPPPPPETVIDESPELMADWIVVPAN